jgi:hypothetical protein
MFLEAEPRHAGGIVELSAIVGPDEDHDPVEVLVQDRSVPPIDEMARRVA